MNVLIACEESQTITTEFRKLGHEAYSCDIQECSGNHPKWHIKDDVLKHLNDGWDLMIGHPPCTRLCNSGVRWLQERNLWYELNEACKFFNKLLNANINKICIENPIPHKYALQLIGKKYDQIIQPWQFGHGETKATCLWLKNLPTLKPTDIVNGRESNIWKMPPTKDRAKIRSKTFFGIANAKAEQWNILS